MLLKLSNASPEHLLEARNKPDVRIVLMVFNAKIKAPRRLLYAQWDSTGLSQRVLYVVDVLKVHSTLKEALEIS